MFNIQWEKRSVKQLAKLQIQDRKTIFSAVSTLANWPECQNVKRLVEHKYPYRLKIGRFRVFFDVETDISIITIEEVKKRDERTY